MNVDELPFDLRKIATAVAELAYYRTVGTGADDLARSVAHELQNRVSELPEVRDE